MITDGISCGSLRLFWVTEAPGGESPGARTISLADYRDCLVPPWAKFVWIWRFEADRSRQPLTT